MNPTRPTRMRRAASHALPRFAMLACVLAAPAVLPRQAHAGPPAGDDEPPLTIEGQAVLRDRLAARVLLVQAWPAPAPLEDPSLVPTRIGMAAVVARDGRVEVWTAAGLVADATRIELTAADGGRAHWARVAQVREDDGRARLECPDGCPSTATAPEAAPADACEDGRPLSFVVPAGHGGLVLGHTVVAGPEAPPLEALVIVPGRLPLGTPLFDPQGRPAAIVLRPHASRTDRALAAPLTPRPMVAPAPETGPVPDAPEAPEQIGPAPEAPGGAGLTPEPRPDLPVMGLP